MKHKFTTKREYTGTCGDHYCPGHYELQVKCSCGWKKTVHEGTDLDKLLLQHRLDYLEGAR
jgi:hypothetical protein